MQLSCQSIGLLYEGVQQSSRCEVMKGAGQGILRYEACLKLCELRLRWTETLKEASQVCEHDSMTQRSPCLD